MHGLLAASFALVELPGLLLPGFGLHLEKLQKLAEWPVIAFDSQIAPTAATPEHVLSPPSYAAGNEFEYNLNDIRANIATSNNSTLTLRPMPHSGHSPQTGSVLQNLKDQTTLDDGQAIALYESLSRGLAFTQGPPGTGKTFLGVSLAQVILASQDKSDPKPILAVCMTNHALDSFLGDLLKKGIAKIARLGSASKEEWTKQYHLRELNSKMKLTRIERYRLKQARQQVERLARDGAGWTESLSSETLGWCALQDHLRVSHKAIYDQFVTLERLDSDITDLRRAKRYAGFGYEFWFHGGDIRNLEGLLQVVNTLLGDCELPNDSATATAADDFRERLLQGVKRNATSSEVTEDMIWALSASERHALVSQWIAEMSPWSVCDALAEIHRRHQAAMRRRRVATEAVDARCLAQQQVIGLTTSGLARFWNLLNQLKLRVTIVEEAGEVLEAHTLVTLGLPSTSHFVSIGDPQQLRPQVNEMALSMEHDAGRKYSLDESLFERLMFPSSDGASPIPTSRLNIQRRMHPDIADISRAILYPYLVDHQSTKLHPPVAGMVDRMYWLNHRQPEDRPDPRSPMSKSYSNRHEVEMVAGLVKYLIEIGGYSLGQIAILTPYNGQLAAIAGRLRTTCSIWLSEVDREALIERDLLPPDMFWTAGKTKLELGSMLRVATIDNFQGEEAKVVIFSAVRSNDNGRVGFLRTVNRVNVACSRARDGFYIIGNAALMSAVEVWAKIIDVFTRKQKIGPSFKVCCSRHPEQTSEILEPEQFSQVPPCPYPCQEPLSCGHACQSTCHSLSIHELMPCTEHCQRVHACGHQCTKLCSMPCGSCTYQLPPIKLQCGHEYIPSCGGSSEGLKIECQFPIDSIKLPCGHSIEVLCSSRDQTLTCGAPCGVPLFCGHECASSCAACSLARGHPSCQKACGKIMKCGHTCEAK